MAESHARSASLALAVSSVLQCAELAAQSVPAVDLYGSLRTQIEAVSPDRQDRLDAYTSLRDAYSRLGINVEYQLGARLALTGQLELAADSANLRLRDPYDQGDASRPRGQPIRVARIRLQGGFGSLTYGQQWMPYYNAIAAPVDRFSSYYSGYATYTVFRVARTLAFSTPEHKDVILAAAYAGSGGNMRSTSRIDARRWQASATYAIGNTRIAAAIDDRGDAGYGRNRLYGLALSHQADKLYLAVKYEIFDTGNRQPGAFSTDGNRSINVFGSYARGRNTVKLMLAKVEHYGGRIVHLGIDHHLSEEHRIFAEYYHEADSAALTKPRGGLRDVDARLGGGHAVAFCFRYDF